MKQQITEVERETLIRKVCSDRQLARSLFDIEEIGIRKATGSNEGEYAIIRGIATTITPDRYNDIVESLGAVFNLPMPFLWQHDAMAPVGNVMEASPTAKQIPIVARMPLFAKTQAIKDRIDEAYESAKLGLVRGLSIGFCGIYGGVQFIIPDDSAAYYHFQKWEWLELSLVTIPANAEATISTVKAQDELVRAAVAASGVEPARIPLSVRLAPEDRRRASLKDVIFK